MRLATTMMSPRLAGDFTRAPEPIVMATSFSVSVWQICEGGDNGSGARVGARCHQCHQCHRSHPPCLTFRMAMQWDTRPLRRGRRVSIRADPPHPHTPHLPAHPCVPQTLGDIPTLSPV